MATNASTWFYSEPEHDAYLIEERVNHTFWSNRITDLHFDCVSTEPPFRMTAVWRGSPVEIKWEAKSYFILAAEPGENTDMLLIGIREILGLNPTISYVDPSGQQFVEWYMQEAADRVREIQGNATYSQIKRYM